jgi:2-C-methyl-D-erythritol 4-phosphate cytidylyltransferase
MSSKGVGKAPAAKAIETGVGTADAAMQTGTQTAALASSLLVFAAVWAPFDGVQIVAGGKTERWETVRNALAVVPSDATHVAVHDAARPGASDELLGRVFEAAKVHSAVIPGLPVADTLKRVSEQSIRAEEEDAIADMILGESAEAATSKGRFVESAIDRTRVVAVQTPQVFEISLLRRAYAQADLSGATDDAGLVERLGERARMVGVLGVDAAGMAHALEAQDLAHPVARLGKVLGAVDRQDQRQLLARKGMRLADAGLRRKLSTQ